MQLARSISDSSYFLDAKLTKEDRRNYKQLKERGYPPACLFVGSLSNSKNLQELKCSVFNLFKSFGEIMHVTVHIDEQSRPFAFVQFKKESSANAALLGLNNCILDGRFIRIERAKVCREICITVLGTVFLERFKKLCSFYGEIESIRNKKKALAKNEVFVKYSFREDACEAMNQMSKLYRWKIQW
jgi:RNA recognition motif-containing protein